MTENRRFLPGEDPPPEPALATDRASRGPNGLDHMGFLLQVVQVVPVMMTLFGLFLSSVWELRVTTAATLAVAWGVIMLLPRDHGGRRDSRRAEPRDRGEAGRADIADAADRAVTADEPAMTGEPDQAVGK